MGGDASSAYICSDAKIVCGPQSGRGDGGAGGGWQVAGEFPGGFGGGGYGREGAGFDSAEVVPVGGISCVGVVAQVRRLQGKVAGR